MKIPILFIVFNRPEITQKVFDVIRLVKPKLLFVAADGPRNGNEDDKEKCKRTRNIIEQVDWDCDVKTLFRDENLGCGHGPATAITWFFDNVEEGIILEDDCLPDLSFFPFCEELLEKYRLNQNVFMVSGDNFLPKELRVNESYYFSNLPHIGGWATWRRAWKKFNFKIDDLPLFIRDKKIEQIWYNKDIRNHFLERFKEIYKGKNDVWDYQWTYTIWSNNGFSVAPNANLISNIGFGIEGTHTHDENDIAANLLLEEMKFPLVEYNNGIYELGDNYEKKFFLGSYFKLKKILKSLGLFKIIKKIYLFVK